MSSDLPPNPPDVSDIAKGVILGFLEYGEEKIKNLAKRFLDGELAFIEDDDTIKLVKEQLKTGEWSLCTRYIKDPELKTLITMGLTLRKLDETKKPIELENLRNKLHKNYRKEGLRIAEFVQSTVLNDFIASLVKKIKTVNDVIDEIEKLLRNLDRYVIFIQQKHKEILPNKIDEIYTRLKANTPEFLIIFTSKSVIELGLEIIKDLNHNLTGEYEIEVKTQKNCLYIFLFREGTDFYPYK